LMPSGINSKGCRQRVSSMSLNPTWVA
jgi:hypothetical protein